MEKNNLELYAYAPSVKECKKHNEKFESLSVKKATMQAQNDGAYVSLFLDRNGNGLFHTRTAYTDSINLVWSVLSDGDFAARSSAQKDTGACLGISVVYDPESRLVRNSIKRDFIRHAYNINNREQAGLWEEVTDRNVPIVTFGDHEYIWYNKEECESGENPLMDLVILDMPECAKPFEPSGRYNDYALATEQHEQYNRIALQGTNEEERNLLVQMSFSSNDRYEKGTPVYTKEQEEIIERVKASFEPQN